MKKTYALATTALVIAALAGCANQSNTADLMRGHAADAQARADLREQFADDWERGSKLIQSGEKQITKGEKQISIAEKDLEKGNVKVSEGRAEIAEGQALMQESEQKFRELFPSLELKSGT